ncbi:Tetratricopeptide repeat-containing protein [Amycolatopsis xylanica]|uniref:Tetratricopeptide repeat-containing protein n=2 Tax=Amycolatopsis xylanica TaxID=589385 RepID=A0A1H3RGK1_9PSEU|nr:Tetratricopeptide repeat-containing protein [Amycolatopsis xylanica]
MLTAYVNESVYDVPTAIETVVSDLASQGGRCREFPSLLSDYRQRRHELETDPTMSQEISSILARTVLRVGLRVAGDIPVLGAVAKEVSGDAVAGQFEKLRDFLVGKFRNYEDVRLILSPVEVFTTALVRDLTAIASSRSFALFVDTYEQTGAFLERWLLDLLAGRYGQLPGNSLITIAGQGALDANRWSDYLPIRTDYPLEPFTNSEVCQLLNDRGVTNAEVVEVILELSGRLPVWVAALASAQPEAVDAIDDPSGSAVERFLKWESDQNRRTAAVHGALPRRLDRDVFAAVAGSQSADEHFAWLRKLPFVMEQADGYRYHEVVRTAMLRVLRRHSVVEWQNRHQSLTAHYRAAKDSLALSGRAALKSRDWQQFTLEESYHFLCAQATAALPEVLGGLVDVIAWHPTLIGPWTQMIEQAGKETNSAAVAELGKALRDSSSANNKDIIALLTKLVDDPMLDIRRRATARHERSIAYRETGRLKEALDDANVAIEICPDDGSIIACRGRIYELMKQYEHALSDFDRAIDLDPKYTWAIISRGNTYRLMGRHQEALADLDRAINLDARHACPIADRGHTYLLMGRYEEAISDFSRAVELDPSHASAIVNRAQIFRLLGRHEEALCDLDRAITLDAKHVCPIVIRGEVYLSMGRNEDALAEFDRAVDIEPRYGWALYLSALAMLALGGADAAYVRLRLAIDCEREKIDTGSLVNLRAFNISVYQLALGNREEAFEQVRNTLACGAEPADIRAVLQDFRQLHAVTGCDVDELTTLLTSNLD